MSECSTSPEFASNFTTNIIGIVGIIIAYLCFPIIQHIWKYVRYKCRICILKKDHIHIIPDILYTCLYQYDIDLYNFLMKLNIGSMINIIKCEDYTKIAYINENSDTMDSIICKIGFKNIRSIIVLDPRFQHISYDKISLVDSYKKV